MLRWAACLCLALLGCGAASPPPDVARDAGRQFADFSQPEIQSAAMFERLASLPTDQGAERPLQGVKFVITNFSEPGAQKVYFLDGRHYQYHDEWFWFRLINGKEAAGVQPSPSGLRFSTPDAARVWARDNPMSLPAGLRLDEGRLVAPEYYELSLEARPRQLGSGTLIYLSRQGRTQEQLWSFQIDPIDVIAPAELELFFSGLERGLPKAIAAQLVFIPTSPAQHEMLEALADSQPALAARTREPSLLTQFVQEQVYAQGLVAGRLWQITRPDQLVQAPPDSVLLMREAPSELPATQALLTSLPQTPLSHVSLLAITRGTVNAYRASLASDPRLAALAARHAPILVHADAQGLELFPIPAADYQKWQAARERPHAYFPPLNVSQLPYVVDLSAPATTQPLHPSAIGGKSAAFAVLLRAAQGATPYRPLAISARPFVEHIAPLLPLLRRLFADPTFQRSAAVRYLALEGPKRFLQRYPGKSGEKRLRRLERSTGPVGEILREGGVAKAVRSRPLSTAHRRQVLTAIAKHFAALPPSQGLRFRSSSTVEDIEGFSGAGLYRSSTGFLQPERRQKKKERKRSFEWAVLRTWASYFSFEAFEERRSYGIAPLSGAMGLLVHPRFDDRWEQANGVFTLTMQRRGANFDSEIVVNAQKGALSVTNPESSRARPEVSRVARDDRGRLYVERRALSSELSPGAQVLSNDDLLRLYEVAVETGRRWLERESQSLPRGQVPDSLVLDFEFRRMHPDWPGHDQRRAPVVFKQLRSLEPAPRLLDAPWNTAPIPRDRSARASGIDLVRCEKETTWLRWLEVYEPGRVLPFVAQVELVGPAAPYVLEHWQATRLRVLDPALFALEARAPSGDRLSHRAGTLNYQLGERRGSIGPMHCQRQALFQHPRRVLERLLSDARATSSTQAE